MRCPIILLLCVAPLFAQISSDSIKLQHQRDDEVWSAKSGLPSAEVRAIRISAGIGDTTPNSRVNSIDANSFKQRNHVLVVEGPGCTRLHMIERGANGFAEIWSLNDVPGVRRYIGAPAVRPVMESARQVVRPAFK